MTPIYDKSLRRLLLDETIGALPDTFSTASALRWFAERYPRFQEGSITLHLRSACVNTKRDKYSGKWPTEDLRLFKLGPSEFTRYDKSDHGVWENGRQVGTEDGEPDEEALPEVEGARFALEVHLEEFMEANWNAIDFGAPLQIYADDGGSPGRQYETDVGQIDFLCRDTSTDDFVVIELKRDRSSDAVVGQVLRYMGWVHEHLADGRGVRGIIVTHEHDDRLRYAVSMLPNVEAWTYSVSFELNREAPL